MSSTNNSNIQINQKKIVLLDFDHTFFEHLNPFSEKNDVYFVPTPEIEYIINNKDNLVLNNDNDNDNETYFNIYFNNDNENETDKNDLNEVYLLCAIENWIFKYKKNLNFEYKSYHKLKEIFKENNFLGNLVKFIDSNILNKGTGVLNNDTTFSYFFDNDNNYKMILLKFIQYLIENKNNKNNNLVIDNNFNINNVGNLETNKQNELKEHISFIIKEYNKYKSKNILGIKRKIGRVGKNVVNFVNNLLNAENIDLYIASTGSKVLIIKVLDLLNNNEKNENNKKILGDNILVVHDIEIYNKANNKHLIINYLGLEKIKNYKEIILIDDGYKNYKNIFKNYTNFIDNENLNFKMNNFSNNEILKKIQNIIFETNNSNSSKSSKSSKSNSFNGGGNIKIKNKTRRIRRNKKLSRKLKK
jgi:hypothetical protein